MKVKIIQSVAGINWSFWRGDVADVDSKTADYLIRTKAAVVVEEQRASETATAVEASETAVQSEQHARVKAKSVNEVRSYRSASK